MEETQVLQKKEDVEKCNNISEIVEGIATFSIIGEGCQERKRSYVSWDDYFMAVSFLTAMRSKDPATQVGACIVSQEKKIVGIGYNGMPSGCNDDELPWVKESNDPLQTKYMYVCHAELNAIMNKNSADLKGCKIYVALFPCNECAKLVIQSGIREVIYFSDKHSHKPETIASKLLMDLAGVKYRQHNPSQQLIKLDFSTIDENWSAKPQNESKTILSPNGQNRDINKARSDYLAWGEYFMAMAFLSAKRSKDPSTQVGACIVNKQNKIVGIGYNGMPLGCCDNLLPWGKTSKNRLHNKYMYVCHAEMNAVMNKNCADVAECCMYVALFPCNECTKIIIQAGIKEIVYFSDKYFNQPAFIASRKMLDLAGVSYRQYSLPRHSVTIDFTLINGSNLSQLPPTPKKVL